MSEINYEDARIEGGIEAFADVLKPDRTKGQVGQDAIPSPEGIRRYAKFVESLVEAQQIPEEDEDFLAAA